MSQPVDALWKSLIKQLQQLPALGPEQRWDAFPTIDRQIRALFNQKSLPRATWKHLIRELKVPLQLGTICRSLETNSSCVSSSSSGGGGSSSSRAIVLFTARWSWKALIVFLSVSQKAVSTSLSSAIAAQLQQSGLLQQFPSILLTVAQLLKDATTTAGASGYCAPAGAAHGQAAAAAAWASSPGPSSSRGSNVLDSMAYEDLLSLSAELAVAVQMLGSFQPQDEPGSETARRLDAAACFCLAVMQLVSAALDSVPADSTAPVILDDIYRDPLHLAVSGLLQVVRAILSSPEGRMAQLLQSPNVQAAVRVLTCTWYARTLMPSTSGKLSSDSVVAAAAAAAAAAATAQRQGQLDWQAAAMFCTPLDPPQQQQQHLEPCLAATGVSIPAAAWAAAWMDSADASRAAVTVVHSMAAVVHWFKLQLDAVKPWRQRPHPESLDSAAQLVAQQAEQNLLLLQLLLCSLEQQPDLLGSVFERCAALLAQATIATTHRLSQCYMAAAVTGPEREQQPSSSSAPTAAAAEEGPVSAALAQALEVLSKWSACMLPTFLTLLQETQQRVRARHTAEAAAASSRSSGDSSSSSRLQLSQAQSPTEDAILPLADALATIAQNVAAARMCEGIPVAKLPSLSWAKHCITLCVALDGCFRLQAGSSGALANSTNARALVASVAFSLLGGGCGRPITQAAVRAGPGSAEQRQLFSMLVSLLKVCGALSAMAGVGASLEGGLSPQQAAGDGPICAALTAVDCLSHRCDPLSDTHSSTGGMAACDASGSPAAAAAGSAGQKKAAAAAATPTDSLPALVLCGRCCLQWAGQLQVLQQQSPDLGERLLLLKQVNADSPDGAVKLLQVQSKHTAVALFAGPQASAAGVLRACRDWLAQGDTTKALAAAGYPAEAILQKLGVLLELLGQPAAAPDAAAAVAAYGQVVQQLQAVGLACNTLAFPDACNNPFCSNMSGATELESVSGRANMCAGCLVARYCSKACQASHWKQHKPVCKALRAAAVSDTAKAE